MKRKTCAECQNLESTLMMRTMTFSCKETGAMVPHHCAEGQATFWRVPLNCPLPDSEVLKGRYMVHPNDWVKLSTADMVETLPMTELL